MAKNLLSNTGYRNLDVDAFDPDGFIEGDEAEELAEAAEAETATGDEEFNNDGKSIDEENDAATPGDEANDDEEEEKQADWSCSQLTR